MHYSKRNEAPSNTSHIANAVHGMLGTTSAPTCQLPAQKSASVAEPLKTGVQSSAGSTSGSLNSLVKQASVPVTSSVSTKRRGIAASAWSAMKRGMPARKSGGSGADAVARVNAKQAGNQVETSGSVVMSQRERDELLTSQGREAAQVCLLSCAMS